MIMHSTKGGHWMTRRSRALAHKACIVPTHIIHDYYHAGCHITITIILYIGVPADARYLPGMDQPCFERQHAGTI